MTPQESRLKRTSLEERLSLVLCGWKMYKGVVESQAAVGQFQWDGLTQRDNVTPK